MYKLLIVLIVGVLGGAIWRRDELRSDADRASKAIKNAASEARSRIRPESADDAEGDGPDDAVSDDDAEGDDEVQVSDEDVDATNSTA